MSTPKSKSTSRREKEVLDIFKRNFEAQFGAIESEPSSTTISYESSDQDSVGEDGGSDVESSTGLRSTFQSDSDLNNSDFDDSDNLNEGSFNGFSNDDDDDDDDDGPQVVKFTETSFNRTLDMNAKQEKKKFMVSSINPLSVQLLTNHPQTSTAPKLQINTTKPRKSKPDENETENLENDVALQRLLNESHLLAEANTKGHFSGADISTDVDLDPIGKTRLKALQMRMQQLTGKKAAPEKMPMNMRKGLDKSRKIRQEKYETYAKEAGIVLARPSKDSIKKKKPVKRDRGLKIASVGKDTRHGLVISKAEIAKYTSGRGGKKGRRK